MCKDDLLNHVICVFRIDSGPTDTRFRVAKKGLSFLNRLQLPNKQNILEVNSCASVLAFLSLGTVLKNGPILQFCYNT